MRFKLDENLGRFVQDLFRASGHDAATVVDEGIGGSGDSVVFETSQPEGRCLVTLGLDFADVVRFGPAHTAGIAILRSRNLGAKAVMRSLVSNLLEALSREEIAGRLWIVELGRVRIHDRRASGG